MTQYAGKGLGAEQDISLKDVFAILLRRIWLVVAIPVLAAALAALYVCLCAVPVYTATASLYVLNRQSTDTDSVDYADLQSSALLTADYRELILSKRVLNAAGAKYGLTADELRKDYRVEATGINNTRLIEIAVTSEDPVLAAELANAIGEEFSVTVVEIMDANNVNFVDAAEPPPKPSAPKKLKTVAVAAIFALAASVVLVLTMEMMNTTIRTQEDVEKVLGLPVLAHVPRFEVK